MRARIFFWAWSLGLGANLVAQVPFTGTPVTIDFDSTVSGVSNGQFAGGGFTPTPVLGQLDSDAWAITGPSDGDLVFGGTGTSGDFARGASAGGEVTGGVYAFQVNGAGDVAFGFQASNADLTPGSITLLVRNNTGGVLNTLHVSYDIYCYNDKDHSTTLNLSYSTDGSAYTPVSAVDYTSPLVPDAPDALAWQVAGKATTLSGLAVAASADLLLRLDTADASSGGARDEIAIDNLTLQVPEPRSGPCVVGLALLLIAGRLGSRRRSCRRAEPGHR